MNLVLFFTRGISLKDWDKVGMFEREVALYRGLQGFGAQIRFITYGDASDLQYQDRIPGIGISCNHLGLPVKLYEMFLPLLHAKHLRNADVYKSNQTDGADVALRASRLWRKKFVSRCGYLWSQFASWQHGSKSSAFSHAQIIESQVFKHADRLVVTSQQMKDYILIEYGIENSKVEIIPNYVLSDLFCPASGDRKPGNRICFVGRLDTQKNVFALLEAVTGLDVELIVIGEGPFRKNLEADARMKSLNVRFLGGQPHELLLKYFNESNIVILPSLYEGHPKTLIEAMACGRPVIGTNVPGIREIIDHRVTGYLCEPSPESIRTAIQVVLSDSKLQAKMCRNARLFAEEHFALEKVLYQELTLIREVVLR